MSRVQQVLILLVAVLVLGSASQDVSVYAQQAPQKARVWAELYAPKDSSSFLLKWDSGIGPRIIWLWVFETGPANYEVAVPFSLLDVFTVGDGETRETLFPRSGSMSVTSHNSTRRWITTLALLENGQVISGEPFFLNGEVVSPTPTVQSTLQGSVTPSVSPTVMPRPTVFPSPTPLPTPTVISR